MTTFTREDFEMAARAVGFIDDQTGDDDDVLGLHRNGQGIFYVVGKRGWHNWNPPEDDGDALRLAVKLLLGLTNAGGLCRVYMSSNGDIEHPSEPHGDDPCAATRLAIFRAAIAIGRAMNAPSAAHEAVASIERTFAIDAPGLRPKTFSGIAATVETAPDQQLETLKTGRWRLALTGGQTYPVTVRGVEAVKPPEKPSGIGDIEVRIPTTPRKP